MIDNSHSRLITVEIEALEESRFAFSFCSGVSISLMGATFRGSRYQ